jgi:hypothetical protein
MTPMRERQLLDIEDVAFRKAVPSRLSNCTSISSSGSSSSSSNNGDTPSGKVERCITSFLDVPGQIACVVYFRGCSIRCDGCQNCELRDPEAGGTWWSAGALASHLNSKRLPSWVCFQGGEPLDQPAFLEAVIERLDPRFKVAIYTGYGATRSLIRHRGLLSRPSVRMFKAGPFIQARRVMGSFLATSNQELFVKTVEWEPVRWQDMTMDAVCTVLRGV